MDVWRKTTTRNGKTIKSKRFYGTLRRANGSTKHQPLTHRKDSSAKLLRRLQVSEDDRRANGTTDYGNNRLRPVSELLDAYEAYLNDKRSSTMYVVNTMSRCRLLLTVTKTKTIADMDANRITTTLATWRSREDDPISVTTSNHYARAVKSFAGWLQRSKLTPDHPLIGLRLLNAKYDRKRNRRSLSASELNELITKTERSDETLYGLSPLQRSTLYRVAAYTGLRARELHSLTGESIDLEAKTINVQAAYSKRRRNDVLPLHPSLVGILTSYVQRLKPNQRLFPGTWVTQHVVRSAYMIRADLQRTDIPYQDGQGRYADFHALRHTFITSLARSGVHPSKAKELARHSTITLTMDVYTSLGADELRDAIATLPTF